MPFKPGQSGNPGGRPRILADVKALARQHTAEAIETLVAVMRDPKAPPAARALASNSILDRAYGRPAQSVEATIRKSIVEMSDAELLAIAALDDEAPANDEPAPNGKAQPQH